MILRLLMILWLFAAAPAAAAGPKPLFEASDTIHIAIRGPIPTLVRNRSTTRSPPP